MECSAIPSQRMHRPVRYCALLPAAYDAQPAARFPILYWLHGLGGNEQMFLQGGAWNLVEHLREERKIGDFIILLPDGDNTFFINSRDGRRPYEDFFLRELLPAVERKYRVRAGRANRAISGASMGGYGALHMAFRHPELFGAVSAHSAALFESLPAGATSIRDPLVRLLEQVFGSPFDQAYFRANNPLTYARTAPLARLKIYFDCGSEDDYGFYTGARVLDRELTTRKLPHEFHIDPGGHDWTYFAAHMPAAMEFHWKIFAAAR